MYLGFSVSSKPNFKDLTGSISASVGRIDSKWKSVTHQAGIYAGEDGYDINVGNGTTLEGAVAGVVAIGVNTGYGVYAENEKEKLREEYRQWKNKVKNE